MVITCLFFVRSSSFAQGPDSRPRVWDKGKRVDGIATYLPGLRRKVAATSP